MGRRGPPKTPTRILKLRGSPVAKQREKSAVQVPSKKPTCPRWLDKDARAVWHLLIPQLAAVGLVTKLDRNALTMYCRLFSRWVQAEKFLQERGTSHPLRRVTKDGDGKERVIVVGFQIFPQVREADSLASQLLRLEQNFGLTPSARASLQTSVEKKQDDGKARFFKDGA